jgi:hypothetical protein
MVVEGGPLSAEALKLVAIKSEVDEDALLGPQLLEALKFASKERCPIKSGKSSTNRSDKTLEHMARLFFRATTKLSSDQEDILPQEDSETLKLSVFHVFTSLFPIDDITEGDTPISSRDEFYFLTRISIEACKRNRLHFNKVGYNIYGKEQVFPAPQTAACPHPPRSGSAASRTCPLGRWERKFNERFQHGGVSWGAKQSDTCALCASAAAPARCHRTPAA